MSLAAALPHPCLVADVGGTNARFALAAEPGAPPSPMLRLPTGGRADFAETVRQALTEGGWAHPKSFLIAAAGPVAGRTVTLTNAATPDGELSIDGPRLADALGLEQGLLFNDFEALSLSLPFLRHGDLLRLGGGSPVAGAPLLVVGPGTGLGVGALITVGGRLLPIASEGGHVSLGPDTDEDFALWPHLPRGTGSAEDLISGRGLTAVHAGVAALRGVPAGFVAAAAVADAAGQDPVARASVETFLRLLGRLAGDMALTFCAAGGVFIGGGIAPRLSGFMREGGFRRAFESQGPQNEYLRAVPTTLITSGSAALTGLAAVAAAPQRFALDYAGRFWRSRA
jgi:glucokinase